MERTVTEAEMRKRNNDTSCLQDYKAGYNLASSSKIKIKTKQTNFERFPLFVVEYCSFTRFVNTRISHKQF